jgi:hypothetical protein
MEQHSNPLKNWGHQDGTEQCRQHRPTATQNPEKKGTMGVQDPLIMIIKEPKLRA